MGGVKDGRTRKMIRLLVWIYVVAGIGLRIYRPGAPSLWHDEAHSWWISQLPLELFWQTVLNLGVHPPAYFLGLRGLTALFGESEIALRLLSLAADTAALGTLVWLGGEVGEDAGCLAAAWFWAFHPMAIFFALEARPYALAAVLSALSIAIFLRQRRRPHPAGWIGASLVVATGLLTHYYFFLVAGLLILLALWDLREAPRFFRRWTFASMLGFLPLAGWLAWFLSSPAPSLGIGWIQPPRVEDPPATLWNLVSGYGGVFDIPTTLFGLTAAGLTGWALASTWCEKGIRPVRWFLVGLLVPLVAVWVLSFRRPVYLDRYFIVLAPVVAVLVAAGGGALSRWRMAHRLWVPGGLLALALGIWSGVQVHTADRYRREDWRGLVSYLEMEATAPAKIWLTDAESVVPFQYYAGTSWENLNPEVASQCRDCWWVARQPYTPPHAFTQSVGDRDRPWAPALPEGCSRLDVWDSGTGLLAWRVECATTSVQGKMVSAELSPVARSGLRYCNTISQKAKFCSG